MKFSSASSAGIVLPTVIFGFGCSILCAGDFPVPPTSGRHRLLAAAAPGKKESTRGPDAKKKESATATLSAEDVQWLKDNYGTLIDRATALAVKKAGGAVASHSSGKKHAGNAELATEIIKWHQSYENYLLEKKADLEKAEKSLAEAQANRKNAKTDRDARDAKFYSGIIPARREAVKKAKKEYECLQALPSVVVAMP